MSEGRRSPRYRTTAHVQIPGLVKVEGLLKNISVTGCCVECPKTVDLPSTAQYQLEIIPEPAAHIGNFQLQADCKWMRSDASSTEIGFAIVASPKGRKFQNYVDYLAYNHSHS